jgi:hypothetical protein
MSKNNNKQTNKEIEQNRRSCERNEEDKQKERIENMKNRYRNRNRNDKNVYLFKNVYVPSSSSSSDKPLYFSNICL